MIKNILLLFLLPYTALSQNYTSFFTGSTADITTNSLGGICLMGGATEPDNAMKWFLQKANGGDVLVLRTTGSNGYNTYLYSTLGIPVNSVETIVCNNQAASNDAYILQKIQKAEAIWFAGGDQWQYISYWRNTPVANLINQAIQQRNIVVGGTSAGMAILGKYYFSAQNGTVTSSVALSNPYNNLVTVDSTSFIANSRLSNVITDTHFDNPDRRGRLTTFLARIYKNYNTFAKAIACDEYTAVCVEPNGLAKVFGGYPTYDDNAYFIQSNCDLSSQAPENCSSAIPLTWNLAGQAIKTYQIKGTATGQNTFNLNDWKTGSGGTWLHWSSNNGVFSSQAGSPIVCSLLPLELLNFSGNMIENAAHLIWKTDNEVNTSHFEIEKSNDGITFIKAGEVKCHPNSAQNTYTFIDQSSTQNITLYYRLKQVDFDNSSSYSKTISLKTNALNKGKIILYPNPSKSNLTINANTYNAKTYKIYNQLGEEIKFAACDSSIDISQFSTGIYYISFYDDDANFIQTNLFVKE
jgi:cyanophycinase-like exopeptidase